ncbi:hypothetical protein OF83DRAFT_1098941, partial [Amylostereum chailletii]
VKRWSRARRGRNKHQSRSVSDRKVRTKRCRDSRRPQGGPGRDPVRMYNLRRDQELKET